MKPEMDVFAGIAAQRYAQRSDELVMPEPIEAPPRVLPLDRQPARSAFRPLAKTNTATALRKELAQYRRKMAPFLVDRAPPLESRRVVLDLKHFDWREETDDDRQDFVGTLSGAAHGSE